MKIIYEKRKINSMKMIVMNFIQNKILLISILIRIQKFVIKSPPQKLHYLIIDSWLIAVLKIQTALTVTPNKQ